MIAGIIVGVILEALLLLLGIFIYINVLTTRKDIKELVGSSSKVKTKSIRDLEEADLPSPVKRYLEKVLEPRPRKLSLVALRQSGSIRMEGNDSFYPFKAEQYYSLKSPGFIWIASVRMFKALWISVKDRYFRQKARMQVKMLSAFIISDSRDKRLDISTLIRYLMEIIWFPFLFTCDDIIDWQYIDDSKAKATIKDGKLSGSAVFYFGDDGLIYKITTDDRFMAKRKDFKKSPFTVELSGYQKMEYFLIPSRTSLYWGKGKDKKKTSEIVIEYIKYL